MGMRDQLAVLKSALLVVVPGSGPITDLVSALLNLALERQSQLDRLERKLDDVRDAPFRHGQQLLLEARQIPARAKEAAGEAAKKFQEAHAIYEREPELAWWPALYVSTLSYALGDKDRAIFWLRHAHDEAVEAIQARCATAGRERLGRTTVSTSHASTGVKAIGGILGVAVFLSIGWLVLNHGHQVVGGGIVGFIVAAVLVGVVYGAWKLIDVGEKAGEQAAAVLQQRYRQRLEAAQDLARYVDAMDDFATRQLRTPRDAFSRYEIRTSPANLSITYQPTSTLAATVAN